MAQVRQAALWHHLRSRPDGTRFFGGQMFHDDVTDLKEALRIRYAPSFAKISCAKDHWPDALFHNH